MDCGKHKVAVACDVNEDATSGKVGDDLIFRRLCLRSHPRVQAHQRQNQRKATDKPNKLPRMIMVVHCTTAIWYGQRPLKSIPRLSDMKDYRGRGALPFGLPPASVE